MDSVNSLIKVENLSLEYPVYGLDARSFKRSMLDITTGGRINAKSSKVTIKALDNISFTLEHNDRLALIGHNGAGKSTLLRVLAGIYKPKQGNVVVQGKISALLNLTFGMSDFATGYENIKMRGYILGLSKAEIKMIINEVEQVASLGNFLSMPIKTYSSGMKLRLAFAISTAIHPEILLIDEAVGAGDKNFRKYAEKRLTNFVGRSHIMVLASHEPEVLKLFCNKAIWLRHGSIVEFGDFDKVNAAYQQSTD